MPPAQSRGSQFYSEWSKFGVSDTFERVASTFGGQGSSKMMRPSTAQGELKNIALFFSIDGSNHRFDDGIERSLVSKDSQHESCLDPRAGRRS
jgi:hypothetical protein